MGNMGDTARRAARMPGRHKIQPAGVRKIDTLTARLEALLASRRENAGWNAAYEEMVAALARTGFMDHALKTGEVFPDFMLPNAEGRLVSLAEIRAAGPVVISFFRGEWCPFCRLMLAALAAALPEIEAAGGTLLALTPETGGLPLDMKTYHKARFEVLADVDCGVGLAAGVIFTVPKLYRARLVAAKLHFPERHGNGGWFLPIPATYIIRPDGVIAWRFLDVDFSHRPEPADIVAALRTMRAQA
jgi:peroxiredoxin